MKIGNVEFKNNIFLAPMAGITDLPFRLLCKEQNCGLVYTEMVSAKGLLYENRDTENLLQVSQDEGQVAVQLFGRSPEILSEMAKRLELYPFDIVDINMGCPAPKIVRNGEGSALMQEPELIGEIVRAVSGSTKKPVTIKIRKGFEENNINAVEVAMIAEKNGASGVTVHGRTRSQYYSGNADWDIIRKVKESVQIPVVGNGDICDEESAEKILSYTNCDAIMIGRAAQGNPWIFKRVEHYLRTGEKIGKISNEERICTCIRHTKMLIEQKGNYTGIREMRKHLAWYIKGIKGATAARVKINAAESLEEFESILNGL